MPWRNTFEEDWSIPWYNQTVATWLDAHVRGDPAALAAVQAWSGVSFQDSQGEWHNVSAWPPRDIGERALHLGADASLGDEPGEAGALSFVTRVMSGWSTSGFAELQTVPVEDALYFRGGAVDAPQWYVGNPSVNLTVSVDRPNGGYLLVELWDVPKDDPTDGFFVTEGHLSLAQRDGRDKAVEVPTGVPMDVTVEMYAIAHVLEPGRELILVVTSQDSGMVSMTHRQQHFTVHLGEDANSALHLPTWVPTPSTTPAS